MIGYMCVLCHSQGVSIVVLTSLFWWKLCIRNCVIWKTKCNLILCFNGEKKEEDKGKKVWGEWWGYKIDYFKGFLPLVI
jgi:hypothetical protein